jgi:acyl-CoA synthetase (NDP forming)
MGFYFIMIMTETPPQPHFLEFFLNPKSIAIYGANENLLGNMGSQQLLNIIDSGYKGKIFPIHLNLESVYEQKAYKSIKDLPEVPDLAVIILPAKIVPTIFEELGEVGVKNVVLVTAGFREVDNADGELELKKMAHKAGIRFMGPNCLGFINNNVRFSENPEDECMLNITWVTYNLGPGNVSIASQSGTFAAHTNFLVSERDLNLNKALSIGNEGDIDICDALEYFEQDPFTEVILLYIEEIKRGRKFMELAKRITPKKPIIAMYVGGTEGGSRAVSSHTGSMAGNDQIFDAVFEQTGIVRVYTVEEFMDAGQLFSKMIPLGAIPRRKRLAIVTTGGGPAATMSDKASRIGLEIPEFSEKLKEKIKKLLPKTAQGSQASNPLDYTFTINPAVLYGTVPRLLAKSGEVDAIITYGAYGPAFFNFRGPGKEVMESPQNKKLVDVYMEFVEGAVEGCRRTVKKKKVPIIYINFIGEKDEVFRYLNKMGFPTFRLPHQAVQAVYNLMKYGEFLNKYEKITNIIE